MKRLGLAILAAFSLSGQTPTGQFTGQVQDPSGAAVPEAKVSITNLGTGIRRETATNASGNYSAPLLSPGEYRLVVQKEGFRPVSRSGVTLQVDQVLRIDFTLELGAVSETVEVSAEAPLIDQATASLGAVVENAKIVDLPLNTRNAFRLALIAPGVTPAPGFGDQFNTATGFRVNGGRANQNEIMVDGVSNALSAANPIMVVGLFPSPDALQEFKIQTSTYSAEYGRTAGGVINMVIKSGTNEFHGSAYEFLRNSVMDSNTFFANRAGQALPSLKRNQFGFTFGGPIVRNKAFFFGSYEGLRLRAGTSVARTLPTAAEKSGDFSNSFARVAGACVPINLFDPTTTRRNPSGAGFLRDAFPGNRIPSNRMDPVGLNIAKFYPDPNTAGDSCTGANNFFSNKSARTDTNQTDTKFDWAPTDRNRMFFGLAWRKREDVNPNHYGNIAEPSAGINGDSYPSGSLRLDYTRVQSPSLILNLRAGVTRFERHFKMSDGTFRLASLGFPAALDSQIRGVAAFPQISVTGFGGMGNQATYTDQAQTLYSWNASATAVRGRHTLKFGWDFRINQALEDSGFANSGNYTFTQAFTQGPDPNAPRADRGSGIASLLLGTGSGFTQVLPSILTSNRYSALYVQDDWRLTSKLTLNLGLRWDLETSRKDRFNQLSWFDFTAPSPLAQRVPSLPNLQGGLRFPDRDGRNQFDTDWNNIGPRAGFAWSLTPKTVIRGGYGIFYLPFVGVATGTSSGINGFLITTDWVNSADGGLTPLNYLRNPYPGGIQQPTGSSLGLLTNVGTTFGATRDGAIDRSSRVGYMQQWNLSVQRDLGRQMAFDVVYSASKGTKLMDNGWEMNQLHPDLLPLGSALQQTVPNPFLGVITQGLLAQPQVTRGQLLRPYPHFLGLMNFRPAAASSTYHSFQASFQKRFTAGSSAMVSYTKGKSIDDSTGTTIGSGGTAPGHLDTYNRRLSRSVSSQDVSQRLVGVAVYELPFGRGRRFGSNWSRLADLLAGGWQANAIVTYSTAPPLAITAPNNTQAFSELQRPNQIADAKLPGGRSTTDKLARWFDTSAFVQPQPFTFGNAPRLQPNVRSDALKGIDFSLFKEFTFAENRYLQFRAESFNLTNTPQFGVPGTAIGAAAFGVVGSQANQPRQLQLGLRLVF